MRARKRLFVLLAAVLVSVALCPAGVTAANASSIVVGGTLATQASSQKGLYEYTCGNPSDWGGTTVVSEPGYTLQVDILKKKGKKLKLKVAQDYFYGSAGYYSVESKKATVKLKNGKGKFSFKTLAGDKGKGRIKLVSKKRIKMSLKTTAAGKERIPLSTGGKYKTLKRARYQYHI